MAVDTARKRKSMLKVAGGPIPNRVFVPTGTVDALARAVLLNLYGGIGFDPPSPPSGTEYNLVQRVAATILRKVSFTLITTRPDDP